MPRAPRAHPLPGLHGPPRTGPAPFALSQERRGWARALVTPPAKANTMTASAKKAIPAVVLKSIEDIPVEFDMPVKIPLRNGTTTTVTLQCLAHEKTQWGAIRDRANAAMAERQEERIQATVARTLDSDAKAVPKIEDVVREEIAAHAALVLEFATGWDFSNPLTAESLANLENRSGGALIAFINAYELAIYQSRLGN